MISTRILPTNLLDAVKRSRPVYDLARRARFALGSRLGARRIESLGSRAHYNDFMLLSGSDTDVAAYRRGAVEFVGILGRALGEAGRSFADIGACLEVGCGYGRIIRELRGEIDARRIAVCDVIDEGARFTAAEFGVRKVAPLDAIGPEADGAYDLIYLLSVYTHLDRPLIEANLTKLEALLRPGGVVVFTTHGKASAEMCERYDQYWLDKDKLNATLDRDGFYYERYPYYYVDYGLTWILADEMKTLVAATTPALELVAHHSLAIDGHQDVFVYRKR